MDRVSMNSYGNYNRGHHSGVGKAIEAHRARAEERQNRTLQRLEDSQPLEQQLPVDVFERSAPAVENDIYATYDGNQGYIVEDPLPLQEAGFEPPARPPVSVANLAAAQTFTQSEIQVPSVLEEVLMEEPSVGTQLDVQA